MPPPPVKRHKKKSNKRVEKLEAYPVEDLDLGRALASTKPRSTNSSIPFRFTIMIGLLSIGIMFVSRYFRDDGPWTIDLSTDRQMRSLFLTTCRTGNAFCSRNVALRGKTFEAITDLRPGEPLLEIPRRLQIWDIDAFRHYIIREELFPARVGKRKDPLPRAAFLGAFLAVLKKHRPTWWPRSVLEWLDMLPSYQEYAKYHPILWSTEELTNLLGSYTSAYEQVNAFRRSIDLEYDAFANASAFFSSEISNEDYAAGRLAVMTRSFSLSLSDVRETGRMRRPIEEELEAYRMKTGVDLRGTMKVMAPLKDMYNHHPAANVVGSFRPETRSYTVRAATDNNGIPAGAEMIFSYGRRTESYLFALYGFVNGDGSSPTQASIAAWHQLDLLPHFRDQRREKEERQLNDILQYLAYDDGYDECVTPENKDAWLFKIYKYNYLFLTANQPDRWIVSADERNPSLVVPNRTVGGTGDHLQVPKLKVRDDMFDNTKVFHTCRFLSLAHYDYHNSATELLREHQNDPSFLPPRAEDSLDFRTLHCIDRLTTVILARFDVRLEDQEQRVGQLNRNAYQTKAWSAAHTRLGEMQTLEALRAVARNRIAKYPPTFISRYYIRKDPCPMETLQLLRPYVQLAD